MKIYNFLHKIKIFNYIQIFFIITYLCIAGCTKSLVIDKDTMSEIIGEFYLADQYVNETPQLRGQTDSLKLYPAIVEKYGYTMDEYNNSVRHYLKDKDVFKEIHSNAKTILEKREKELLIIRDGIEKYNRERDRVRNWWVLDSIRNAQDTSIVKDKFLFSIKNLSAIKSYAVSEFRATDTLSKDTVIIPTFWNYLEFKEEPFKLFSTTEKDTTYINSLKDTLTPPKELQLPMNKRVNKIKKK